jgi:hypothetical protein
MRASTEQGSVLTIYTIGSVAGRARTQTAHYPHTPSAPNIASQQFGPADDHVVGAVAGEVVAAGFYLDDAAVGCDFDEWSREATGLVFGGSPGDLPHLVDLDRGKCGIGK